MYDVAKAGKEDLKTLFVNTAAKKMMNEAIIEKDFWVCFILELLFHKSEYSEHFSFKGGTSLSKGYNAIQRFSEDIDLIMDWCLLGYSVNEPLEPRSNTKQNMFNDEVGEKTEQFLANRFLPHLKELVSKFISDFSFSINEDDPQTVLFHYPQLFQDGSILQEIRLEIGSLAQWTPFTEKAVIPYAAVEYPHIFQKNYTVIRMVEAKRTFWEKATILHREANRTNSNLPARYSRHYYDLYMLSKTQIKQEAFEDFSLLESVAEFKDKFYHCGWAKYNEATPETMKLLPPANSVGILKDDYKKMQNMIFGEKPSFDEILDSLEHLENELRTLG